MSAIAMMSTEGSILDVKISQGTTTGSDFYDVVERYLFFHIYILLMVLVVIVWTTAQSIIHNK